MKPPEQLAVSSLLHQKMQGFPSIENPSQLTMSESLFISAKVMQFLLSILDLDLLSCKNSSIIKMT